MTRRPDSETPSALRRPVPSRIVYAVVRTCCRRPTFAAVPRDRCKADCCAQPARTELTSPAVINLRASRIGNTAAPDSRPARRRKQLFAYQRVRTRASEANLQEQLRRQARGDPESSVVQCGQRVAFIGMVVAHAGQSFVTGSACDGCLSLLIPRTSRKIAAATIRKLI